MAKNLQQLIDEYETWEEIPDTDKPSDERQRTKLQNKFEEARKKAGAFIGAKKNIMKNSLAGITNDKGDSSMSGNKAVVDVVKKADEIGLKPDSLETKVEMKLFRDAAKTALEQMNGKSEEEQKKIVSEILPKEKEQEEEKKDIPFNITPEKKEVTFSETAKEIEQAERDKEIDDKSSTFLKSWASTHPTWLKILSSDDLSWGQKVALVGSALANIGANVTLGAKTGFEHGSFAGVPWDFKQAVDKYTNQEIETVLGEGEQKAKAKTAAAEFWNNYQKENGKGATDELMALVDLYGDNPDVLSSRLRAMGINKSADEVKDLYANLDKTTLSESAKQKKLETETKEFENAILRLTADEKLKTNEKIIAAKNALNDLQTTSATFDEKTYKLRKIGGMLKDVIETVEGAASTVGGVMTGGVVGKVKDGIIKGRGIPQKIVRADGSEIQLDPNDNVYATKNELTTEKDDGSDIVHMTQDDEVLTLQKRLGYSGGAINKDFEYYLNKLRG